MAFFRDVAIEFSLIWLFIGSLILVVLNGLGVIERTSVARAGRGLAPTAAQTLLAMVICIVAWPRVARHICKNPKGVGRAVAQLFWGRG